MRHRSKSAIKSDPIKCLTNSFIQLQFITVTPIDFDRSKHRPKKLPPPIGPKAYRVLKALTLTIDSCYQSINRILRTCIHIVTVLSAEERQTREDLVETARGILSYEETVDSRSVFVVQTISDVSQTPRLLRHYCDTIAINATFVFNLVKITFFITCNSLFRQTILRR